MQPTRLQALHLPVNSLIRLQVADGASSASSKAPLISSRPCPARNEALAGRVAALLTTREPSPVVAQDGSTRTASGSGARRTELLRVS